MNRTLGRRSPAQGRGERRVERILDAAAELLGDVGYEDFTLRAVAERSQSATGSLYHFFRSKEELIEALVERLVDEIRTLPPMVLTPSLTTGSVRSFVHELLVPIAKFAGRHPELPALMGRVTARAGAVDGDIARRLEEIVRSRAPALAEDERRRIVRMTIEIVRVGIRLFANAPAKARAAVLSEAEIALTAYLRARLGGGAARRRPAAHE